MKRMLSLFWVGGASLLSSACFAISNLDERPAWAATPPRVSAGDPATEHLATPQYVSCVGEYTGYVEAEVCLESARRKALESIREGLLPDPATLGRVLGEAPHASVTGHPAWHKLQQLTRAKVVELAALAEESAYWEGRKWVPFATQRTACVLYALDKDRARSALAQELASKRAQVEGDLSAQADGAMDRATRVLATLPELAVAGAVSSSLGASDTEVTTFIADSRNEARRRIVEHCALLEKAGAEGQIREANRIFGAAHQLSWLDDFERGEERTRARLPCDECHEFVQRALQARHTLQAARPSDDAAPSERSERALAVLAAIVQMRGACEHECRFFRERTLDLASFSQVRDAESTHSAAAMRTILDVGKELEAGDEGRVEQALALYERAGQYTSSREIEDATRRTRARMPCSTCRASVASASKMARELQERNATMDDPSMASATAEEALEVLAQATELVGIAAHACAYFKERTWAQDPFREAVEACPDAIARSEARILEEGAALERRGEEEDIALAVRVYEGAYEIGRKNAFDTAWKRAESRMPCPECKPAVVEAQQLREQAISRGATVRSLADPAARAHQALAALGDIDALRAACRHECKFFRERTSDMADFDLDLKSFARTEEDLIQITREAGRELELDGGEASLERALGVYEGLLAARQDPQAAENIAHVKQLLPCQVCGKLTRGRCTECSGARTFQRPCSSCDGRGSSTEGCSRCDGNGRGVCSSCGGQGKVEERCGTCNQGNLVCRWCNGTGLIQNSILPCTGCWGDGEVDCGSCDGDGRIVVRCNPCGGAGKAGSCAKCNGRGDIDVPCGHCRGGQVSVPCSGCHGSGVCPTCRGSGHRT